MVSRFMSLSNSDRNGLRKPRYGAAACAWIVLPLLVSFGGPNLQEDQGSADTSPSELTSFLQSPWFLGFCILTIAIALVLVAVSWKARRRNASLVIQLQESSDALRESERRYREMFENNPAIQLLIDPTSGRVLEANSAAADYFGNPAEELRDQSFPDLTGLSHEFLQQGLSRLEHNGEWIVHPAEEDPVFGPPIEIRSSLYPLRGEEVVQATIYDIEAKQRLEQQLQEAQKLRAVGELASGVAHDFNNLLTAILGNSELIEIDSGGEARIMEHVSQIRQAGESGSSLVKKLLAFGRKQALCFEELELNEIITESRPIIQSALGSRIVVELDLDDSADRIRADRNQIERALLNIALNARDAMPDGGNLRIQTRLAEEDEIDSLMPEHDPELRYVRLSVQDDGVGMPPNVKERAFEPFFTTKQEAQKSGLGLSTVYGIVGQYGGEASIESTLGEGATIHLYLPMVGYEDVGLLQPIPREDLVAVNEQDQTVLLVEDDEIVRKTIASLLAGTGHRVIQAATAADARDCFHSTQNHIDVVLADLRLPDENGRKLGESLRAERPHLPLIFMSGYYDEAIRSENEVFLMKPFSLHKLNEALERVQND